MIEIQRSPYLTDEVLRYNPPQHIIKVGTGPAQLRHIFGSLALDAFEITELRKLRAAIAVCPDFSVTNTFLDNDHFLLRFLQGSTWDTEKCINNLKEYMHWREVNLPVKICEIYEYFPRGLIYIHGRDRFLRPIIIMRAKQLANIDQNIALKIVLYWLELTVHHLLVPNRVEQWRVVIDLMSVSYADFPLTFLKVVATVLQRNYRGRLGGMFVIQMPWAYIGVVKLMEMFIQEKTKDKINVVFGDNFRQVLLSQIDPNQLENRFGGYCCDVTEFSNQPILPVGPFDDRKYDKFEEISTETGETDQGWWFFRRGG
eukprot:GHVL01022876.1.p1 GENE.GHVL01022876.1~~GHVL01022876.1.p1  ORF type:complete len:314 (+),score=39.38 GHVL01022876.1:40-981(+)